MPVWRQPVWPGASELASRWTVRYGSSAVPGLVLRPSGPANLSQAGAAPAPPPAVNSAAIAATAATASARRAWALVGMLRLFTSLRLPTVDGVRSHGRRNPL